MAKIKTISVGVKVPADLQKASSLALEWQRKQHIINKAKLDSEERIANEKANLSNFIKPLEEQAFKIEQALQLFCEAHREELTSKGKFQHGDIGSATVKWRKTSKVSIKTKLQDAVIKTLKPLLPAAVTVKETLNKDVLNVNRVFVEKQNIAGITFKNYETFTIEMKGKEDEKR